MRLSFFVVTSLASLVASSIPLEVGPPLGFCGIVPKTKAGGGADEDFIYDDYYAEEDEGDGVKNGADKETNLKLYSLVN